MGDFTKLRQDGLGSWCCWLDLDSEKTGGVEDLEWLVSIVGYGWARFSASFASVLSLLNPLSWANPHVS